MFCHKHILRQHLRVWGGKKRRFRSLFDKWQNDMISAKVAQDYVRPLCGAVLGAVQ